MNCPNCKSKTTNKFPNRECQNPKCGMIQEYTKLGKWLGSKMKIVVDGTEYTLEWEMGATKVKCYVVEEWAWRGASLPIRAMAGGLSMSGNSIMISLGNKSNRISLMENVMELPLVYGWNADNLAKYLILI